jgi:arsenate reductase-like glutaredoxin family protein
MALKVKWTKEAKVTYQNVLDYLKENWTQKELQKFVAKTDSILSIISYQPYAFKASAHKTVRKAVINKQNSLFYLIRDSDIYLLSFWDNRRDPKKNKY